MNGESELGTLRDAVGGVLRAWKGAGGSGGLEGLGRALRALERAYGAVGESAGVGGSSLGAGAGGAVLGYGYRVLAGDPEGKVYALRWGAGDVGGAITGVVGPIEGVPVLPGAMKLPKMKERTQEIYVARQWNLRRAALESLPDPGSLELWRVAGGGSDPERVQWAREQSWRFPEPGLGTGGRGR